MASFSNYKTITKNLSLAEKVGQLFMPAAFINDTEEEVQKLENLIKSYHIGSICFFHSRASAATNFEGKKEVVENENSYQRLLYLINRYQSASKTPLLIAIDAEWGLAMRIENTPQYPYAITLGTMQQQEKLVYQVGQAIARDCKKAGIHWNLSPVVDINLNPENPVIGYRSFGENKMTVTQYAKAYLKGMQSQGILNSIKHFPGHGDTATDSHLGLPVIDKPKAELFENELYPFIELMNEDLDSIMVGHLAVPSLSENKKVSASISKAIMAHFLRDELGWNGLIISDALNMHAVSKDFPRKGGVEHAAFEGGNDVLCFADNIIEGVNLILEHCDSQKIESSFKRVWQLKEKVFSDSIVAPKPIAVDYNSLMLQLAQESLTLHTGTTSEIKVFREEGFQFYQIGKKGGYFEDHLKSGSKDSDNVLLSIIPRQVKPNNNFNFSVGELEFIQRKIKEQKTIIYLFGNPFVLNLLPWKLAKAIVVVYQDFDVFQLNAVAHFEGESQAKGKLPVSLKTIEH